MKSRNDILFERRGHAGVVTLNRPEALNAVTDEMLVRLNEKLDEWASDDTVLRVIIKAAPGRAFSAGGDIRHLYERGTKGDYDFDFFAREYALNAKIAKYPKPYIALVDGIAMGGGVGVSFHGSHRIGGEGLRFAMPEVGIGFFPDVGASYFLSRLPDNIGLYLGLTGNKIKSGDANACGLITHTSKDIDALEEQLCAEPSLETVLEQQNAEFPETLDKERIKAYFAKSSLKEIIAELGKDADEDGWARDTLEEIRTKSPTSLNIAFRQIRAGADLDIDDCMRMEYRILRRILVEPDFYEGIRAAIIDKDKSPNWSPATLEKIDPTDIDHYFTPSGQEELKLP